MKHTLTLLAAVLLALLAVLQAANVISSPAATAQYGVRWKVIEDEAADFYLLCQRIESAAGLSVEAFDHIFPWSQIRLCRIIKRPDRSNRICYSDEPCRLSRHSGQTCASARHLLSPRDQIPKLVAMMKKMSIFESKTD